MAYCLLPCTIHEPIPRRNSYFRNINGVGFYNITDDLCIIIKKLGPNATSRKIAGSIPDEVMGFFFFFFKPQEGFGVDSASNRNEYQESSWEVKSGRHGRMTTSFVSRLYRKCGILDIPQHYEPPQIVTGTASPFTIAPFGQRKNSLQNNYLTSPFGYIQRRQIW
jgi:hypothetical protein